jgi:hypothetical protein
MKTKLYVGMVFALAIACAHAQESAENIIRTPAPIQFLSTESGGIWNPYARLLVDEITEKNCTTWLPDTSTQADGYLFVQTRSCNPITSTKTYQDREQNSVSLAIRNVGNTYQEVTTSSGTESQQAYGTGQSGSTFNLTTARLGSSNKYGFASAGYTSTIGSMTPVVYEGRTIHQMFIENASGTCYFKFDIGGYYASLLPESITIDGQEFTKPSGGWMSSYTSPYQYSGMVVSCSLYSSWASGSHTVIFNK